MTNPAQGRLQYVPVTLFTIVMGLCGFTLALRAGEEALGLTHALSLAISPRRSATPQRSSPNGVTP